MSFNIDTRILQERWEFMRNIKDLYRTNKAKVDELVHDIRSAIEEFNSQLNESDEEDSLFAPVYTPPKRTRIDPFRKARAAGYDLPPMPGTEIKGKEESLASFLAQKFGKMVTSKIFLVALVTLFGSSNPAVWKVIDKLSNTSAEMTDGLIGAYSDSATIPESGVISAREVKELLANKFGDKVASMTLADANYVPMKMSTIKQEWYKYLEMVASRNEIELPDDVVGDTKNRAEYIVRVLHQRADDSDDKVNPAACAFENKDCDDWARGMAGSLSMSHPDQIPNYRSALDKADPDDRSAPAILAGLGADPIGTMGVIGFTTRTAGHAINIVLLDNEDGTATLGLFEPQTGELYNREFKDLILMNW